MLELLEQLYLHRIAHLNKFAIRQAVTQVNPDYSIPTKQEISAYMSGQLSLFPKGSGITLIQWQRDKVDISLKQPPQDRTILPPHFRLPFLV